MIKPTLFAALTLTASLAALPALAQARTQAPQAHY